MTASDIYSSVIPSAIHNLTPTTVDNSNASAAVPLRVLMTVVLDNTTTLQQITFVQWRVLVRIFKTAYRHDVKATRNSSFLRKLSEFRTQTQMPGLLACVFQASTAYPQWELERDMRTICSHILHLLITRLYQLTRVDILAEVPVSIYPHPSAQCMVGGWAIFSTHNYYQTLYTKNPYQPKWKILADLVASLSVSASEVATRTGPLTSAFFQAYNRGKLRLPRADLLLVLSDIHFQFLRHTAGHIRSTTFQDAERAILNNVILFERFNEVCISLSEQNPPAADITRAVFQKLTLKYLHVREGQYLSRSNAEVGMTLALRTMLAASSSRVRTGSNELPVRLSSETIISLTELPLVDVIEPDDFGHSSTSDSESTSSEEAPDGSPQIDVGSSPPVARSLQDQFDHTD
jgi:hypothetical protein